MWEGEEGVAKNDVASGKVVGEMQDAERMKKAGSFVSKTWNATKKWLWSWMPNLKSLMEAGWSLLTIIWSVVVWIIKKLYGMCAWLVQAGVYFTKKLVGFGLYIAQVLMYIVNHPRGIKLILFLLNYIKEYVCEHASEWLYSETEIFDWIEEPMQYAFGSEFTEGIKKLKN